MTATSACLLFDLDGTLVDTDRLHMKAFNMMLAPFGRSVTEAEYQSSIMGFPNPMIMQTFFPDLPDEERMAQAARKEALFREMASELQPLPGLLALLDWADKRGVSYGVVTNAPRVNAELMLDALKLSGRIGALVIGDEVARAKPDPLPYLTGLERLGAVAGRSAAFEDSRSGVTAATAAGLATVGVMTSLDQGALAAVGAVAAIRDFTDETLRPFLLARMGLD